MPYNRRQASQLATRSELELVSASYADAIGSLSERALKSNIGRVRKLRDKQRDLLQRQRLANRKRTGTKHGTRADSNARTAQKAELFDETLSRFTRRLEALEAAGRRATKRAAAKRPSRTNKGPSRRAGAAGKKRGQAATLSKARTPRTKAIHAHQGSRGRRSQARRDSR